eukprot:scaffold797_cov408-Chaetoceros_neogracile.AAC.48
MQSSSSIIALLVARPPPDWWVYVTRSGISPLGTRHFTTSDLTSPGKRLKRLRRGSKSLNAYNL